MNEKPLCYQFDDVRVDLQTFKVWRGGAPLPLEPKAFEALVFLIDHRGRLVEKNELLDAVWKDTFVTPNALTRVIARLRRALGDDAREAKYIETAPRRGYRFIAEVEVKTDEPGAEARSAGRRDAVERLIVHEAAPGKTTPLMTRRPELLFGALAIFLIALVFLWKARTQTDAVGVLKTAQFTTSPAMDIYPAFSPDGGAVAYCSMRDGRFEIFVRQLAPGSREIQITSDGADNLQPAWSPDGKMIAFHSRERGGVWATPALGGVSRQIVDFGADPAYSPDGEWIVFQSVAPVDLSQTAYGALAPSTLWIVPSRGGEARPLTQKGVPAGGHGAPSWSPDGKRIVFVTYDVQKSELWSLSINGKDLKLIRGERFQIYDPVYSPDGKYLYASTGAKHFLLWRISVSPETGSPTGEPIEIINTGAALPRHLTIAPDGKRIAYSALSLSNNIGSVSVSPQTGAAAGEHTLLTQDTNRRKTSPAFSPDGKTIAYSVWRMGADGEIWLMDADGGNQRQLTAELGGPPSWLPGGERVALVAKSETALRLWAVDVKSGKQAIISDQVFKVGLGKLSPDGAQFAFNSTQGGAMNIWTIPVAGGPPKQLTFDQELMGFPNWSRDGKLIAFEMKRGDDTHVAVIPSGGGAPTQLTNEAGQSWPGGWSTDGDKIAFAGMRAGYWDIWWVSRDARQQKRITKLTKPNAYVRFPSWSPRGDQIVYEYAETTGNIWVMELK
jgi:Tol biopolymer transport system component/DNA-binding winged helix-turn-helix (wHTH) protein